MVIKFINLSRSYYLTIPEEELRIYASEMKVGMVCAARVFHQWHRGEIVQIEKDSAKVFFQASSMVILCI